MPISRSRRAVLAAGLAAACGLAACTSSPGGGEGPDGAPSTLRIYGTDGIMSDDFAAVAASPSLVAGIKGTRPMPVLPAEFTIRLQGANPDLQNFLFAGETYDAVVISALAAELAGTPDPEVVRTYIKGVTTGGERCRTVAECLELARDGTDLAYRGVSLTDGFTDRGEPAVATYETAHFGSDGQLDLDLSEFVASGDASQASSEEPPEPRPRLDLPSWEVEPLVFGGMLPRTGALSFAHPPLVAGARLAVEDINDAGGVFGVDVEWVDGDTGTDPDTALELLASHVDDGVHVLVGPAASGVAAAILAEAVAAERIVFSPANTASDLVEQDHNGYYFRTAPPDTLQGAALADVLLRDGNQRVVIVARDDAYGRGLQADTVDALERFGVAPNLITELAYVPPGDQDGDGAIPDLAQVVADITAAQADGLVVIGFEEAAQLLQRLADDGVWQAG